MRCSAPDSVKTRVLELSGSSSATMSRETAIAIDCLIRKVNVKSKEKMVFQVDRETNSKLVFAVEF